VGAGFNPSRVTMKVACPVPSSTRANKRPPRVRIHSSPERSWLAATIRTASFREGAGLRPDGCEKVTPAAMNRPVSGDRIISGNRDQATALCQPDKELDKLPDTVKKDGPLPRVVITDSKCEEVIVQYDGVPDRDKIKEIEAKVAEATKLLEKKK
jgi:hypothetical protein